MENKNINQGEQMGALAVANEILRQIGPLSVALIGVKNIVFGNNPDEMKYPWLRFQVGRNPKGVKWVKIILNEALDEYEVEALNQKGAVLSRQENIYFEDLNKTIESETGLFTHF